MARRSASQQPRERSPADFWASADASKQMRDRTMERLDEQEHLDSYVNALTGIGDYTKDKTFGGNQHGLQFKPMHITGVAAEDRWRGSDLGGRVVETIPDEMTREGFDVSIQPAEDDDAIKDAVGELPELSDDSSSEIEALHGKLDELGAEDALWWALCYERAYGGGAVLIGADDGQEDLSQPLDEKRISSVNWLNAFQGGYDGEVVAWSYYNDPRSGKYGLPKIYMLRNLGVPVVDVPAPGQQIRSTAAAGARAHTPQISWVHESRLLVFPGTPVSRQARVQMRGWSDSVFTRIDKVLSDYNQTWGGVANLMTDFSQGVLNIEGLATKLAGGNKASKGNPITTRARQIQLTRSIARMLFLDKDEQFSRETASLAGVSEVLAQFSLRLAAAADMPVTLLMGQAPAGLNATGASDIRFFYDRIAARQRKRLLPQIKRLVRILMLAEDGPTDGAEPQRWNVRFRPLYQMTALETAQLRKAVQETDVGYINAQVVSPEEVAASRFGGSEWTMDTTIDVDGRKEMAKEAKAAREAQAKAEAQAPPSGGQPSPDQSAKPGQPQPQPEG